VKRRSAPKSSVTPKTHNKLTNPCGLALAITETWALYRRTAVQGENHERALGDRWVATQSRGSRGRRVSRVAGRHGDRGAHGDPRLSVTTKVLEGVPHEVIVQEAADWGADLIVLGSHGYGAVKQALLGSVAAGVAAEASCAVEIVRAGRPSATIRSPVTASASGAALGELRGTPS
jgi:nucleotide-binding universal stress UspA family protein